MAPDAPQMPMVTVWCCSRCGKIVGYGADRPEVPLSAHTCVSPFRHAGLPYVNWDASTLVDVEAKEITDGSDA